MLTIKAMVKKDGLRVDRKYGRASKTVLYLILILFFSDPEQIILKIANNL